MAVWKALPPQELMVPLDKQTEKEYNIRLSEEDIDLLRHLVQQNVGDPTKLLDKLKAL